MFEEHESRETLPTADSLNTVTSVAMARSGIESVGSQEIANTSSILNYLMQERREEKEERKRREYEELRREEEERERKEKEENEQLKRREEKLEKEREECMMQIQSSLDGSLVDVYWDTFRQEERDTYETSKCTLMKWCAFSITECIQHVGVVRMKYSETIQEAFQESINHVKTLSNGDSAEHVRFEWAKARTLAKVKRECAEAVWEKKPATVAELVAAVVDWESIHGRAVKSWGDQNRYHFRQLYQPQQQHQSRLERTDQTTTTL